MKIMHVLLSECSRYIAMDGTEDDALWESGNEDEVEEKDEEWDWDNDVQCGEAAWRELVGESDSEEKFLGF